MGERFHMENVNLSESDVRQTNDVGGCPLVPKRRGLKDDTEFLAQGTTTAKVIEQDNDETDTEVDTEAESTTSILDFDSLSVVFSYLDIRDRTAASAVCRRWQLVCEGIWKRVKQLDLSQNSFRKFIGFQSDDKIPVFIRLCPNVTEIIVNFMKDDGISAAIAESCPRLERLTVIHRHRSSQKCKLEGLSRIPLECPHLKSFHFKALRASQWGCTFLNQFVQKVQELEEIIIEGNITERSNWLASLSKPLKSLHLFRYKFLDRHLLKYVEIHGDHLSCLTLAPSDSIISNRSLKQILSLTPNLTQLNLIGERFDRPDEDEEDSSHEIAQLKYLTRLSLAFDFIVGTDGFLDNVVKGCSKLSHLYLSDVFKIKRPPRALLSLVDLDNLVSLNLTEVPCLSEVLPSLTACLMRLRELIVIKANIDDYDFITIMMHGAALEYLDVSENRYLTNVSLRFACGIITDEPSRPKIVIRAFGCFRMRNRSAYADVDDRIHFELGGGARRFRRSLVSVDD